MRLSLRKVSTLTEPISMLQLGPNVSQIWLTIEITGIFLVIEYRDEFRFLAKQRVPIHVGEETVHANLYRSVRSEPLVRRAEK